MAIWFDGTNHIECSIEHVREVLDDPGGLFTGVVRLMPGMTSVELLEQGSDSVTIRTNEGLMKRTNIVKRDEAARVVLEFDEEYVAGSKVSTTSRFVVEFTSGTHGVTHRLAISDVEAPGFLGFLYRRFGSSRMGNAFLTAHKTFLETPAD